MNVSENGTDFFFERFIVGIYEYSSIIPMTEGFICLTLNVFKILRYLKKQFVMNTSINGKQGDVILLSES